MSYALIDNATLTAVQRLLGKAKSRSRTITDHDIAALENLVQAVLFYDDLIVLDDYKKEYATERKEDFKFMKFINITEVGLNAIEELARKESESIMPEIRGGEFADADFASFFRLLKMNIICTWDMSSSVFYLTMKMLGEQRTEEFEKYGKLAHAIFSELIDRDETTGRSSARAELYDSSGRAIRSGYTVSTKDDYIKNTGGMTGALTAFVASLSWLSYKTIYYTHAAVGLQADTFLYPIRQPFQLHYMDKKGAYDNNYLRSVVKILAREIEGNVKEIIDANRNLTINLDIPIFCAWIARECGAVEDVLKLALQLKEEKPFVEARDQLAELTCAFAGGREELNRKVHRIIKDLEKMSDCIRSKYSVKTRNGTPLTKIIKNINSVTALASLPKIPEIESGIKLAIPSFTMSQKGMSIIARDLSRDLAEISRLGSIRDILGARVVIDEDALVYSPKAESPKYRYYKSDWKVPM